MSSYIEYSEHAAYQDVRHCWPGLAVRDERIAALEAQLAERVKVKPLEWTEYETDGWADRADAEAGSFGVFYNIDIQKDGYRVVFDHEAVGAIGTFDTADEAKAAAQADYERRILSALEATPPAPKVTEAMVEALKEARSVIYDTQQSCLYDDDDGQVGVTEDAVISPYHFQKICNSLKVIDDALTAAQEAGKP